MPRHIKKELGTFKATLLFLQEFLLVIEENPFEKGFAPDKQQICL